MERSSPLPAALLRFRGLGIGQRLLHADRDERIQRAVVALDPLQTASSEIDRRLGLAAKQLGSFLQRQAGQILGRSKSRFYGHARGSGKKGSAVVRLHGRVFIVAPR